MLLRSVSAPILKSWLPQYYSRESSPEPPESQHQRRSTSFSLFSSSKSIDGHSGEILHQSLSDHKESTVLKSNNNEYHSYKTPTPSKQRRSSLDETNNEYYSYKTPTPSKQRRSSLDETRYTKKNLETTFLVDRQFSSSGVGGEKKGRSDADRLETLLTGGGGGMGNGGGKICTGGGVGGNGVDDGASEDDSDTYYKEMIDKNPENSLLTGNYAKFLKEVKGDMKKAEEYCERAILGKTADGNVLSLYADLILLNHQDRERAHSYYERAVKMSPDDCYVQASYARFLWDVEEDEDEGEEEEELWSNEIVHVPPTSVSRDFGQRTSITA